ncbi:ATP-binding cassette domain-containing protein [Nonomuraea phyllanthi]|uniref:ABC transporter ATP-binding protein n=1 Tax=Nonomuraea phyllanthi TaxID=2219224 RepID=UPI001293E935|nr:ABC transporter ATP-binding protein [Nonomuraea phyllanthi]QFY09079.1 ATP-binding cassette domain-containing protein [Nonomuraea phyllanthi]
MIGAARAAADVALRTAPGMLAAYVLVMLVEAVTPIAMAWLTKLVVDDLAGGGPAAELISLAVALAVTGVLIAALPQVSQYLGSQMARAFTARTTAQLFTATLRFAGLKPFEDPDFHDRLRLAQSSLQSGQSIVAGSFGTIRSSITLVGMVGSLLVISPILTGIVLLTGVPALVAQLRLSRRRASLMWEIGPTERRQMFYGSLLGTVEAAKEIRLFDSGRFLRGRMMTELRTANAAHRRMDLRELAVEGALTLMGAAVAGGGLVWAVAAARSGALSVGDVSLLIAAVAAVQGALHNLVSGIAALHQDLILFGHYVAVTRAGSDLPVPTEPRPLPRLSHGIEFSDVWFRYSDRHPWILRGVNLFIPAGRAVAVVGLNGAGKSTLVKLLCRFYDPQRGSITWDGVDIRLVRPEDLRHRLTGLFQDHMTYDMSAADNVSIGFVAARDDRERIRAAARRAGIDDKLVSLPRGYDTLLTRVFFEEDEADDPEIGVQLSGGQWQRTALARAMFRGHRDLMILDEPSAGLDPEAEADVHARTRHQREGATSVLISHRLNTVRDADHIVVLEHGRIVEGGTHDELMTAGGRYARLFGLQAQGYAEPPRAVVS